mmetsp:Transcript_6275/g.13561  ORF Transcript_6275/g.13561 Transcript_6275/m.13561 type:complete len:273 (+) Transcript_6275:167-985(+)|eukprot:CAMPEP_0204391868 /NCGR_PEP_ID=MMETSP0469-20131031/61466_1 /ASSEMBLY_ACC=CAM_ASM_000384 /TAXON_ID=2969 /ORGANISM="Oxyrrhis marina" /LENGTH=272 /DNA_ID=CAMNT_0051385829 /DNA_START=151 /DNA_END=969 /DNA_ORIENTATION=-
MDILGRRFSIFGGEGEAVPVDGVSPEAQANLEQASAKLEDCMRIIMKLKSRLQKTEQALKAKTIENEALNEALDRQNEIIVELYDERDKARSALQSMQEQEESLASSDSSSDLGDNSASPEASTDSEVTETTSKKRLQMLKQQVAEIEESKITEVPQPCGRCECAEVILQAWLEQLHVSRELDTELAATIAGPVCLIDESCKPLAPCGPTEYVLGEETGPVDNEEVSIHDDCELVCEYEQPWQHASSKVAAPAPKLWATELLHQWAATVEVA